MLSRALILLSKLFVLHENYVTVFALRTSCGGGSEGAVRPRHHVPCCWHRYNCVGLFRHAVARAKKEKISVRSLAWATNWPSRSGSAPTSAVSRSVEYYCRDCVLKLSTPARRAKINGRHECGRVERDPATRWMQGTIWLPSPRRHRYPRGFHH